MNPTGTTVNGLRVRSILGRREWSVPEPFGPDGWQLTTTDGRSVIVTAAPHDGEEWIHASIAGPNMPSYEELALLHRAAFGDGYAYQVFAPASDHINIHEHALHLWGRADGARVTPDFGRMGTI